MDNLVKPISSNYSCHKTFLFEFYDLPSLTMDFLLSSTEKIKLEQNFVAHQVENCPWFTMKVSQADRRGRVSSQPGPLPDLTFHDRLSQLQIPVYITASLQATRQ